MISIHALLAESDEFESIVRCYVAIFLSTLSLRRATGHRLCHAVFSPISIHALLAESDDVYDHKLGTLCISIHALLAESDSGCLLTMDTPNIISIHALLAESDGK